MFLVRVFSYSPFWLIYGLAEVISFLLYYVFRYRRGVVRKNLVNSFPEKNIAEIKKIEKQFYRNLPRIFLESVKSYHFTKEDWAQHVKISNPELPQSYFDKGIPVILMAGHTANWEWCAFAIEKLTGYNMEFIYKPVKNKMLNQIMLNLRQRHGGIAVPKEQSVRQIIKRRKKIRFIGMIGDQLPSMGTEKRWIQFLNQETPFYIGGERLATMVGYTVLYIECKRESKGKYLIRFSEIASPPYEKGKTGIIESFVRKLEVTLNERPSDYLWSHKRWKYTQKEEEAHLASL